MFIMGTFPLFLALRGLSPFDSFSIMADKAPTTMVDNGRRTGLLRQGSAFDSFSTMIKSRWSTDPSKESPLGVSQGKGTRQPLSWTCLNRGEEQGVLERIGQAIAKGDTVTIQGSRLVAKILETPPLRALGNPRTLLFALKKTCGFQAQKRLEDARIGAWVFSRPPQNRVFVPQLTQGFGFLHGFMPSLASWMRWNLLPKERPRSSEQDVLLWKGRRDPNRKVVSCPRDHNPLNFSGNGNWMEWNGMERPYRKRP